MWILQLDETLTGWLYRDQLSNYWQKAVYITASSFIYLLPLTLLVLFFRSQRDRLFSVKMALSAVLSWQVFSNLVGHLSYAEYGFRNRPFFSQGIQEFFFEQPQKAFPSDHSAVFAAIAAICFVKGYKKLGQFFLVIGLISSIARVVIGFHWVGDVVGGWVIGVLAALIISYLDRPVGTIWLTIEGRVVRLFSKK